MGYENFTLAFTLSLGPQWGGSCLVVEGMEAMRNMTKLLLLLLSLGVFAGIYKIKVETWQLKRKARILERSIAKEERAILVLRADWAYLTRPERIERLARKHLGMRPVKPGQIIVLKE